MDYLTRYKGQLSREQLITAKTKILINAENLLEEAMLLLEHKKLARAYFLANIASEEIGKYIMVISAIVNETRGIVNWKKFWSRFRNHKAKTSLINHMENIFVSSDENFTSPWFIDEIIPDLEEYKMAMLYSDMFINDFFIPDEIVDEQMTLNLIKLTENRIQFIKATPVSDQSLRELKKEDIEKFNDFMKTVMGQAIN